MDCVLCAAGTPASAASHAAAWFRKMKAQSTSGFLGMESWYRPTSYAPDQAKPMHIADAQASVFAMRKRTSTTQILFSQIAPNLIYYRKRRALQLHARLKPAQASVFAIRNLPWYGADSLFTDFAELHCPLQAKGVTAPRAVKPAQASVFAIRNLPWYGADSISH